jgi:hypothetical protein
MYGVQLAAGFVQGLGEQGLVGFDTEKWDEGETREKEKSTQDPGEARASYGVFVWRHSMGWMGRNRDGSRCRFAEPEGDPARGFGRETGLAWRLLSIGLVQQSLGQKSKDHSNEVKEP